MSDLLSLDDIENYHIDIEESLELYFSSNNPEYTKRFIIYSPTEVDLELVERKIETDRRSVLVALARIEAAFRKDYLERCRLKMSDTISIDFRKIYKKSGKRAKLDDDILDVWYQNVDPPGRKVISLLRGMLKFRHWLAHGRYWVMVSKYSFQDTYLVAKIVLADFPLYD
jgi:hypothetical protein